MKIIYFFFLLPILSYSQTKFNRDGSYEPVSFATTKSAAEIYNGLIAWLGKIPSDSAESPIIELRPNDYIIFRGSFWNAFQKQARYDLSPKYKARYTIRIDMKDKLYVIKYIHKEFRDSKMNPVPFDLNSVLNGYCSYLGDNAIESYEFHIGQLFESIHYYIENGKRIKRSEPLREYPCAFRFNEEGSANVVVYKSSKTAGELYVRILDWFNKNYAFPEKMVTASAADKTIRVENEIWNVFEKEFDNNNLQKKRYTARYSLIFEISDNSYKVNVVHKEFIADVGESLSVIDLPLSEITGGKSTNPDLEGGKEGYEYKINKTLYQIDEYLKSDER